ncbi:hypothetical protein BIW11_04772 [Tropilaelaps mercedesae]|uniref:Uncharacterized protein n=1 Tax=Tropilaelaps mercedesae TaxID=418985 RepID=A0A1V9X1I5_9ACAR|nr:hypothetical protein BIW11_04772 [Tropilaelaps mercedesae]
MAFKSNEEVAALRDAELSVVLFGDQGVGKKTWLRTLGKTAINSQSYYIAHDVSVHVFKMRTDCPKSPFCTFQIYMRPSTSNRSNHSWLGGLEHGYTVNAQGFFLLFDLSNIESFWHQNNFSTKRGAS